MPHDRWDALVRGEDCPFCVELANDVQANELFRRIAELQVTELLLAANENVAGYCVLVFKRHVREPYELSERDCAAFFQDLMNAARALEWVFNPTNMNFEMLGNVVPHLRCHINSRYYGDPWPGSPVRPGLEPVLMTDSQYRSRVAEIRAALGI